MAHTLNTNRKKAFLFVFLCVCASTAVELERVPALGQISDLGQVLPAALALENFFNAVFQILGDTELKEGGCVCLSFLEQVLWCKIIPPKYSPKNGWASRVALLFLLPLQPASCRLFFCLQWKTSSLFWEVPWCCWELNLILCVSVHMCHTAWVAFTIQAVLYEPYACAWIQTGVFEVLKLRFLGGLGAMLQILNVLGS